MKIAMIAASLLLAAASVSAQTASGLDARVTEGFADSNGVRIHYATIGSGPLVVMIHGFPDYWYTWRHQMESLADRFQVVAIDPRGWTRTTEASEDTNRPGRR